MYGLYSFRRRPVPLLVAAVSAAFLLSALCVVAARPAMAAIVNGVRVSNEVRHQDGEPGATFVDRTFAVITPDREVFLAGLDSGRREFSVDDVLDVQVTHPDGTTKNLTRDFSNGCSGVVGGSGPLSLADLVTTGLNTIRIRFRDACGGGSGTTGVALTGNFDTDECANGEPGQWAFHGYASDNDGLVVDMARLGPRKAVRAIQVPYFKVKITRHDPDIGARTTGWRTGELTLGAGTGHGGDLLGSRLVSVTCDTREMTAAYEVEGLPPGLHLRVEQKYVFHDRVEDDHCEPRGDVPCARFWPNVRWIATDDNPDDEDMIDIVTLVQRIDLRPDDRPRGRGEVFRDHSHIGRNTAVLTLPLAVERSAVAMRRGERHDFDHCDPKNPVDESCTWDNYHQTGGDEVALPGNFGAAGCRECVHYHWAWSSLTNTPVLGSWNFTNGRRPAILEGSEQDATIAVVAEDGNTDPYQDGFRSLLNGEKLKDRHPIMYWESTSPGTQPSDPQKFDEAFPILTDNKPGDRGSIWFAPASTDRNHCAPTTEPQWKKVWEQSTDLHARLPAGWVLPVKINASCRFGEQVAKWPTIEPPDGPFYVLADTRTPGQQLLNADDAFETVPVGTPYLLLRKDTYDDDSSTFTADDEPVIAPGGSGKTAYLVFSERPTKENVSIDVAYAPDTESKAPYPR